MPVVKADPKVVFVSTKVHVRQVLLPTKKLGRITFNSLETRNSNILDLKQYKSTSITSLTLLEVGGNLNLK